jgi:transposase InsO family protein
VAYIAVACTAGAYTIAVACTVAVAFTIAAAGFVAERADCRPRSLSFCDSWRRRRRSRGGKASHRSESLNALRRATSSMRAIAFWQLFVFFVLGHRRRQLLWFDVTQNPTAEWLVCQITEAFSWDRAPKYFICDNDGAFGGAFKARVRAMGIRDRPTSFRSPWQNGYAERLIGSVRRECTDHLIAFNAEHLRRILAKYAAYYNEVRTHVSLGKDAPCTRSIERFGDDVAHPILGGLHHRYA